MNAQYAKRQYQNGENYGGKQPVVTMHDVINDQEENLRA